MESEGGEPVWSCPAHTAQQDPAVSYMCDAIFFFFPTFQFLIQQLNFLSNSYDNGHILDSYISKALEKTTLLIPGNPYFKQ